VSSCRCSAPSHDPLVRGGRVDRRILAAVYLLWACSALHGEPDDENRATPDIGFGRWSPCSRCSACRFPRLLPEAGGSTLAAVGQRVDSSRRAQQQLQGAGGPDRAAPHKERQVIGAAAVAPIAHAPVDWFAVAPEIALFPARGRDRDRAFGRTARLARPQASMLIAIAGVAAAGVFTGVQWGFVHGNGPYQALSASSRSTASRCSCSRSSSGATFAPRCCCRADTARENLESPEYFALMLCSPPACC